MSQPVNKTTTGYIISRWPIAYGNFKRTLEQINVELRPHGLTVTVHTVTGCFVVERLTA